MSTEYQSSSLALSAILLTFCIYFGAAQSTGGTVYYIVPESASGSPPVVCPGEPCLTIFQFVFNRLFNSSFRDGVTDIIMQLQPGYHNLSLPFTIDTMRNSAADSSVSSIVMTGTGPDDVTLLCTEDFSFNFLDSVRISGINLVNCGGPSTHIFFVTDFTLEDSTFQSDMPFHIERVVGNLVIANSVFSNCTRGVLLISNPGSRPTIRNCTFSNNVNLRTMSVPGSNAGVINFMSLNGVVDQCTFINNRATFTGGAIYLAQGGLAITNSYFFNNSVVLTDGGAVYSINASLNIEDSNFTNNFGQNDGGAVAITAERGTLTITRTEFTNNTAGREGGAVLAFHSNGNDASFNFGTTIEDSSFVGNSAAHGGAVMNRGSNILFSASQTSFIENTCSDDNFGSGALSILSSRAQVHFFRATFTRNQGVDGAMGMSGSNYNISFRESSFVENVATRSGGAIVSSSSDVGNIEITDSEFNRNSAPQCGALDLNADDMNPNIQTRGAQIVRISASNFANNTATVSSGGALCASDISISILSSTPVSTFTQNSAVTGGGAISASNSFVTISEASFFDNTALSGGDTINACSSNVTVDSSAISGQLNNVTDSECVVTTTTLSMTTLSTTTLQSTTVIPTTTFVNGEVSSYNKTMINLMLFSLIILLVNYY